MRIASLDIETTSNDAVIEIGVLFMDGTVEVDRYESLIDPMVPLTYLNSGLSGITDDMVAGQPMLDDVLPSLFDRLHGWTVLGHNVRYDLGCLNRAAVPMGLEPLPTCNVLDTMELSRNRFSDGRNHSLLDLLRVLGLADHEQHRALPDAIQTWQCYRRLVDDESTLEWTDSLAERSRQTRASKDSLFLKSRFLENVDTDPVNVQPDGEVLSPGSSATVTGTGPYSEFLASYGDFTYVWVELDLGVFPSGTHAGKPTYHVSLDGRPIGYLTSQTAAKCLGRLPDHAVCRAHTKCEKKTGVMKLRIELPIL